jgi:hypothetical protein
MSRTADQPIRPSAKTEKPGQNEHWDASAREFVAALQADLTPENEQIVRDRLKTYERDKAAARPWPEVKARLLRHSKV